MVNDGHAERFVSLDQGGKAEQWLSTLVLLLHMASRTLKPDLISSNTASWHEIMVGFTGTLHAACDTRVEFRELQRLVTSGPKCCRLQVEVGSVSLAVNWYPS